MTGSAQIVVATSWSLCVGLSFLGWGHLVSRVAWPGREPPGWGLQAGWGMAFAATVGGLANLLGLAVTAFVLGFVGIGAVAALWAWRSRVGRPDREEVSPALVVAALMVLHVAARARGWPALCDDDGAAYFAFIQRQLELGSVIEPYSLRRLGGMGGQTFLQSLVVAAGSMDAAFVLDRGLAPALIFGLLRGFLPRGPVAYTLLAAAAALALPPSFYNSQAFCSAIVLLLTLVGTLDRIERPRGLAEVAVTGMVLAAFISLRAHYLVAGVLFVGTWAVAGMVGGHVVTWLRVPGMIAVATVAMLSPWMASLWMSSGTPLWPIFHGNDAWGYDAIGQTATLEEWGRQMADYFFADAGIVCYAGLLLLPRLPKPQRTLVTALHVSAAVTSGLVMWRTKAATGYDLDRYLQPLALAALLASVAFLPPARMLGHRIVVLAAVPLLVFAYNDMTILWSNAERPSFVGAIQKPYHDLQAALPPGASVIVAVDTPYLFDFRRQAITLLDMPGSASPPPGLPLFRGPEALLDFLRGQGFDYVIYSRLELGTCIYTPGLRLKPLKTDIPDLWKVQARHIIDFVDTMDEIARHRPVAYQANGFVAVRISDRFP